MRHRGLLLSTLLALGVMPPLPTPRREVDLAAAEKLIADLQAAGIDACAMADMTGPEDFVMKGRLALQVHKTKKAMGEHDVSPLSLLGMVENLLAGDTAPGFPHGIVDLSDGKPKEIRHEGKLLATVYPHPDGVGLDYERPRINPPFAQADAFRARLAEREATMAQGMREVHARVDAATERMYDRPRRPVKRSKPDRDRPEQRAAKKTRARAKARRGW